MPLGSLHNTFGPGVTNADSIISSVAPSHFRVHLINGPCIRNKNCGPYEIGRGYDTASFNKAVEKGNKKILAYVASSTASYKALAEKYTNTVFIVSPVLEHNLSIQAYRKLADAVRAVWPGVQLANSPVGGISIERYLDAYIERHGSNPQKGADIVSLDGAEATDINIDAWLKKAPNAKIMYTWSRVYNCRDQAEHFTDPRARKSCPKDNHFEELVHITDAVPAPPLVKPTACTTNVAFKSPSIWKPMAEDSADGDRRANKPVAITQFRASIMEVLAANGQKVGQLAYFGTYGPKQFRHYSGFKTGSGLGGYEFQKKAQAAAGTPWVYLRSNKNCTGPLVTGRRAGLYK